MTDFGPEAGTGLSEGNGMIAVRRRSSGEERFYAKGEDPAWFTELLDDVEKGHFGQERRSTRRSSLDAGVGDGAGRAVLPSSGARQWGSVWARKVGKLLLG